MKIVITGANGLLGKHLQYKLYSIDSYRQDVVLLDRMKFNDDSCLISSLQGADVVIHCAGINRDSDEVLEGGNRELADRLIKKLNLSGAKPYIIYTNSIQRHQDNPYGRGKIAAHGLLADWALENDSIYSEVVLPHVFGEGGRPLYNSAVHTFCYQVVQGENLSINGKGELELIHAQDVACAIVELLESRSSGELIVPGEKINVAELAGKIIRLFETYTQGIFPDLRKKIDLQLFNTIRSYMYPKYYPKSLQLHTDERGSLFEAVKTDNGGQVFFSTTKPGITRGEHFHFHKVERFLVVKGRALIRIRRLLDDTINEIVVSGDSPAFVDIPTLHTHHITNIGTDDMLTLFWSHEIFTPSSPDTIFEPVFIKSKPET